MTRAPRDTALDKARAAVALASIGRNGTLINSQWYESFPRMGLSHGTLDRALNQLVANGKIVIEADQYGVCARRVEGPAK